MDSRGTLRALVLAAHVPWLLATARLLLMHGSSNHGGLAALFNMYILVYCSTGVGALLLTITWSDEPVSLTRVESTPLNEAAQGAV